MAMVRASDLVKPLATCGASMAAPPGPAKLALVPPGEGSRAKGSRPGQEGMPRVSWPRSRAGLGARAKVVEGGRWV